MKWYEGIVITVFVVFMLFTLYLGYLDQCWR